MSQTNNASQNAILNTINKVEGFDPAPMAVEYTDLTTQEKRKRLPVMAQLAWFRLKHPEGKIALNVEAVKDHFVATARIYVSYKDPVECYLSEATASRRYDPTKPTVSPREWAQTAAVGIALRNAGFGLQFGAAGDDFESQAADELGVGAGITPPPAPPVVAAGASTQTGTDELAAPPAPAPEPAPVVVELTPEQKFAQACAVICPIKKHGGKTLGEVLQMDPRAINWLADNYSRDETVRAAANFIRTYSLEQASA